MQSTTEIIALCDRVPETAFALHRHEHLERVYENALMRRLRKLGMLVKPQHPLPVLDEDGTLFGDYLADIFGENCLIVEIKSCKALAEEVCRSAPRLHEFLPD